MFIIYCLSICPLMDIWVVSTFGYYKWTFHFCWIHIKPYRNSMFNCLRNCQPIFQSSCTILYSPPAVYENEDFSTSSQIIVTIWFFNSGHPSGCEVASHHGSAFHVLMSHLFIFFGEMSEQIFCPFLKCSFYSVFIHSEYSALSDNWFVDIFTHFVNCLLLFR